MSKRFLFIVFLLFILKAKAQDFGENLVPPSPDAAALSKGAFYDISNYTGIANISVPIHTLKSGDLSLPISLNYFAGGFTVAEEASWVGLGWTLSAGGVITRQVKGLDDFGINGYKTGSSNYLPDRPNNNSFDLFYGLECFEGESLRFFQEYIPYAIGIEPQKPYSCNGNIQTQKINLLYNGERKTLIESDLILNGDGSVTYSKTYSPYYDNDLASDEYYFSLPGYGSGTFMFDDDGQPILKKNDGNQLQIKTISGSQVPNFVITVPTGVKYYFDIQETTLSLNYSGGTPLAAGPAMTTAWYLSKIESATGAIIDFSYSASGNTASELDMTESTPRYSKSELADGAIFQCSANNVFDYKISRSKVHALYLDRIDFDNGYMLFNRADREDLYNGKRLQSIELHSDFEGVDTKIKQIELENDDYFTSSGGSNSYEQYITWSHLIAPSKKRLKLNGLKEINLQSNTPEKTYTFTYNSFNLPSKTSYSVDHWGYFNSQPNASFVPTVTGVHANGSNRDINPNVVTACMLNSITYPTGGTTTFNFGANGELTQVEVPILDITRGAMEGFGTSISYDNYIGTYFTNNITVVPLNTIRSFLNGEGLGIVCSNCNNETVKIIFQHSSGNTSDNVEVVIPINNSGEAIMGGDFDFTLEEGISYTVVVDTGAYQLDWINLVFEHQVSNGTEIQNVFKPYPGVRINSVADYDPISNKTNSTFYNYRLIQPGIKPRYSTSAVCNSQDFSIAYSFTELVKGNSISGFGNMASGRKIGYGEVEVLYGEEGAFGKSVFNYKGNNEQIQRDWDLTEINPQGISTGFGDVEVDYYLSRTNGDLISRKDYSTNGVVKTTTNTYETDESIIWQAQVNDLNPNSGSDSATVGALGYFWYGVPVVWNRLVKTEETINGVSTITEYKYENPEHKQVTQVTNYKSKDSGEIEGNPITTKYKYAPDYADSADDTFDNILDQMKSEDVYMIAPPIEVQQWVGGAIYGGTLTEFKTFGPNNNIRPYHLYALEPDLISSFGQNKDFVADYTELKPAAIPYFKKITYEDYSDDKGNLKQYKIEGTTENTYLWGYNNSYPVIRGENIDSVTLQTEVDAAISAVSPSYANLDAFLSSINNDTVPSANWKTFNDNLRNNTALAGAMISTYTYDPLIGVTSMTDPKGYTIYYEYDDLNRLEFVKDADGNLLSENKYNYKN